MEGRAIVALSNEQRVGTGEVMREDEEEEEETRLKNPKPTLEEQIRQLLVLIIVARRL